MKYHVPGTLAYYRAAPHFQTINLSTYPVAAFGLQSKGYYETESGSKANPDKEAVDFYALNHLAALVSKRFTEFEQLPGWANQIMDRYTTVVCKQTLRLTFYTFMVVTRETRHNHHAAGSSWQKQFGQKYGQPTMEWFASLKGGGSNETAAKFRNSPPNGVRAGTYARAAAELFFTGSFGGSFGGKPWGEIAQTLARFVDGETTAEMFIDTAYTLAHNNGPMFNKGMLYDMYSSQFLKVLDVQRSGQVPEMVIEGLAAASKHVAECIKLAQQHMPEEIGTYVDWFKVEALGSLHEYPNEKKVQVSKYGQPGQKVWEPQVVPGAAGTSVLHNHKVLGQFKVMPHVAVDIIERSAA